MNITAARVRYSYEVNRYAVDIKVDGEWNTVAIRRTRAAAERTAASYAPTADA